MSFRIAFFHAILLTMLAVAATALPPAFAQNTMLIEASLNSTPTQQGAYVVITGKVVDTSNAAVPNAVVSIEVTNPEATSIHLAVAYSATDGSFRDSFLIPLNSPGGNYTAYLVADKSGYGTTRLTLGFNYLTPDFSLQLSTRELTLHQGDIAKFTLTLQHIRGFNEAVNFTAFNLPSGMSLQFSPASITSGGTIQVSVIVSETAVLGNFTITLLGISATATHTVSLQVVVTKGPIQALYFVLPVVAVAAIMAGIILQRRRKRSRRRATVEEMLRASMADEGYVATARVIARLEELRASNQVDESTYQRLKKEYEKRLAKSK